MAALTCALRDRGPRVRAQRVLAALDIRLDTNTEWLSEPGQVGTLIVANHISWLDIVALAAVEPAAFLAKREVGAWPVIGRGAARLGTVFIDRDSLRGLPASVAEVARVLRQGRSVVVFPEGTTSCTGRGCTFRRATLQAAVDAGAPVRPVTLDYLQAGGPSTVAAFLGDDPLPVSLGRVCAARNLTVRLRAHWAITPAGGRRELAATVQELVHDSPVRSVDPRVSVTACGTRLSFESWKPTTTGYVRQL